jgi:hypothetical protein
MPLGTAEQPKFDELSRVVSEELKIQILAMKRRVTNDAEVQRVADLLSDRIWMAFVVTPR